MTSKSFKNNPDPVGSLLVVALDEFLIPELINIVFEYAQLNPNTIGTINAFFQGASEQIFRIADHQQIERILGSDWTSFQLCTNLFKEELQNPLNPIFARKIMCLFQKDPLFKEKFQQPLLILKHLSKTVYGYFNNFLDEFVKIAKEEMYI